MLAVTVVVFVSSFIRLPPLMPHQCRISEGNPDGRQIFHIRWEIFY